MSVLFTLQPRPGEEYSSDSLDSDYYPGRESSDEDFEKLKRIRKNQTRSRKRKKLSSSKSLAPKSKLRKTAQDNGANDESKDDGVPFHLPPEVMVKIFHYGIAAVGFTKFIPSVARVCKEWNKIASDPSMFEHLDLGVSQVMLMRKNEPGFMKLLKRDISQCHQLSLQGQFLIPSSIIEHIVSLMPRLKALDFFDCNIKPDLLKQLPQLCPLIQRLNLSNQGRIVKKSTSASLEVLIKGLGPNLVELRLSNVGAVQQFPCVILKLIQENCPNMEVLDLSVAGLDTQTSQRFKSDLEELTLGCPRLKELHLDGFNIMISTLKLKYSGFKNLQVYSQTTHLHLGRDMPTFYRLFSSVTKLKMLNVSHSRLRPSLISEWVTEIEELYLQDMRWTDSEEREIIHCLDKWSMSLKSLDLSYNKPAGLIIDMALSQYGKTDHPDGYPLQTLNLSNTNVTPRAVIHVVNACKNLREINLTSCRELPRGTKREFKRKEFSYLLTCLRPFVQENTDDYEDVSFTSDSDVE